MMEPVDWIFIDPARRDGHGGKTIAISECEPDVSALEIYCLRKRHTFWLSYLPCWTLPLHCMT